MPVIVPTDDELDKWTPDSAQKRTTVTLDLATGKTTEGELPLGTRPYDWTTNPSYRSRYKAKMISQKEREDRDLSAQQAEATRQSAIVKLKKLGLEDGEIALLFGG